MPTSAHVLSSTESCPMRLSWRLSRSLGSALALFRLLQRPSRTQISETRDRHESQWQITLYDNQTCCTTTGKEVMKASNSAREGPWGHLVHKHPEALPMSRATPALNRRHDHCDCRSWRFCYICGGCTRRSWRILVQDRRHLQSKSSWSAVLLLSIGVVLVALLAFLSVCAHFQRPSGDNENQ